jgi:predicted  nucleic acid-binding Zn-ribbon protein
MTKEQIADNISDEEVFLINDYKHLVKILHERILKLEQENAQLKERNEKLSKRHPTTEEAIAQYHRLKANSKRNKNGI